VEKPWCILYNRRQALSKIEDFRRTQRVIVRKSTRGQENGKNPGIFKFYLWDRKGKRGFSRTPPPHGGCPEGDTSS
jgi:hypothetical protein